MLNSFLANDLSSCLITVLTSLEPDQDQQNIGRDLDPNRFTLKEFLKKKNWKKVSDNKSMKFYPACSVEICSALSKFFPSDTSMVVYKTKNTC